MSGAPDLDELELEVTDQDGKDLKITLRGKDATVVRIAILQLSELVRTLKIRLQLEGYDE